MMNELEKKILKIASKAVKKAQRDSLKNGVPNVYSKNKKLYLFYTKDKFKNA